MENKEEIKKEFLLKWWELFKHDSWQLVIEEIEGRIETIQRNVDNKSKTGKSLDEAVSMLAELKAKSELIKLLNVFDVYKNQAADLAK